jgi:hypothetical protein
MAAVACGGGSSKGSSSAGGNTIATAAGNVAAVVVDAGPSGLSNPAFNEPFTSVTVCMPGSTSNCQTIDHVLVDTGSYGLRILTASNGAGGELTLNLPNETDAAGSYISECAEFEDSVTYGTIRTADVTIASEKASSVPIQVIGDQFLVPSDCIDASPNAGTQDNLDALGANGILGIGLSQVDCGTACLSSSTSNNGVIYYSCPSNMCADTLLSSESQEVTNPVVLFPTDNNGTILELPTISNSGQNNVSGSLVFGIGTQSNNALGSATVFSLDQGLFTTIFEDNDYYGFTDSGSNGLFFTDSALTVCSDDDFFCSNKSYSGSGSSSTVQNQGASGSPTQTVKFVVENADTLFNSGFTAYNDLAGPDTSGEGLWDWGLPFFFGRNVYTSIATTSAAAPYIAY